MAGQTVCADTGACRTMCDVLHDRVERVGRPVVEKRLRKCDPLIGRDYELECVVQILCRRTKNNPVLIGEAGVGKTAIVEGFAQRISDGEIAQ
jgi:ATP-dependent Clp protease ATP-binding subunit ClpC